MRRLRVAVSALLARRPFASPESTIIKNQHVHPRSQQHPAQIHAMADVPAISVADQNRDVPSRRIRVRGEKPRVQTHAVRRIEINVLKRPPPVPPPPPPS